MTLKNISAKLLSDLREAAQEDRRSLNQQALYLLDAALKNKLVLRDSQAASSAAQLAAWRTLAGTWQSKEPATREIKRIYTRRTKGRKTAL